MLSPATMLVAARIWAREHAGTFALNPIERRTAGRAGGALCLVGGVSAALYPVLPGRSPHGPYWILGVLVGLAVIWGIFSVLVIDWDRTGAWLMHAITIVTLVVIAGLSAVTGGAHSMAWMYLFWVAQYCCYFYVRPIAMTYVVACIGVQSLPLLYDARSVDNRYVRDLIVASIGYVGVGAVVSTGKQMIDRVRVSAETLATEQEALRRAATEVMRGEPAEDVFELICVEIAKLSRSALTAVHQVMPDGTVPTVASWGDGRVVAFERGELVDCQPGSGARRAIEDRVIVRRNVLPEDSVSRKRGCRSSMLAPVIVDGATWGLLALASPNQHAYSRDDEQRVRTFAEMLSQIVKSLDERAQLAAAAMTDKLTGLPNDRALQERLTADLAAAARRDRPLTVAMIDVDTFKEINDRYGHAQGDATLRFVAECLRAATRASDTVGRLGGDEFMWILPDADSEDAALAIERARELIAERDDGLGVAITTSAGICDTTSTADQAELVRRADLALYASKASGRNQVTLYGSAAVQALDADARQAWLERSQALAGLRALARAIDAKDPATNEHSARVAEFVARLAAADGWPEDRVARLREAALVHDVGKLAISDVLLTKPDALTAAERRQMNEHVELSARIVSSILSDEQVSWIRQHHERPDGLGYPDGLTEDEISVGGGLLSLADAWDVMVAGRPYSSQKAIEDVLAQCRGLAGAQFTHRAVRALEVLYESGSLGIGAEVSLAGATPGHSAR